MDLGTYHYLSIKTSNEALPVIRVFLHMQFGEPRLLLVIRLFLRIGHGFPPRSQDLGYVGVVHVGARFEDLAAFVLRPHHEGVHGSLYVGLAGLVAFRLADQLGLFGLVGR